MSAQIEFKAKLSVNDAGALSAIAWPFDTADRVGDMISKSAFSKMKMPIPMLFGHDFNDPIGVWDTATIKSDALHLSGAMLVDELPRAREVRALIKAGAVRGISIGFITKKSAPRKGGGRDIWDLELLEASLVTIPMHAGALITSAKSAIQAISVAVAINRATAALTVGASK